MDAHYPFASRDDIWRVFDELKELHATQFEQAERIARLERRRDEDARMKSVWGPLSPFPTSVAGTIPTEPAFHSPADAFKGFDQGQHHGGAVSTVGLETEYEPRRGASRANSVRFDESAIHGYYGQASRSSSELPIRTGSGLGGHPLTEPSLSHRSDGRHSSSGHSHHSARTNSLGMETTSRLLSSSVGGSPLIPPPGLFLLGPVPCIIRCWLTANFSNESLLYAAACSGAYTSTLGYPLIRKLGLEELIIQEEETHFIKLPVYLPEASLHQASSRPSSPAPQLPTLTIRFLVQDVTPNDPSIQIIIGSDVLRSHNADILFSQDKIIMVDDERNKVSIPLVRPEDDAVFRSLGTSSCSSRAGRTAQALPATDHPSVNGHSAAGVIGQPPSRQSRSTSASGRVSFEEREDGEQAHSLETPHPPRSEPSQEQQQQQTQQQQQQPQAAKPAEMPLSSPAKAEPAGVWGSWKRDSRADPASSASGRPSRGRAMKVLRPSKTSSRTSQSAASTPTGSGPEPVGLSTASQPASSRASPEEGRTGKQWSSNPIGGASAFGWLNSTQPSGRAVTNPK
ncbi:uncharacterized protein BDW47DRAFT_13167 [Aspergillus candidus]|uniref:Ubiquitin carboxyl-terminal hydrolase 19 n=1 Tax=Aspergillus candidus TaxID=41067 RepID=A0A2I2FFU9_ASPCN|nr:ubiquitin carboxyl-terminal hydrolase 19 [Aspergillus candidus]PLB39487.1 ubiquitin carboxyl-terminal hydrolase 19 [Aspergillus candidus]